MPFKARTESVDLQTLKSLHTRMKLAENEKQHYFNLKKGYEGEILFDSLTDNLQCECLILNDLLLKQNNTIFQIDALLIISETVYFFEVKNYEGDYYYESDKLYKKSKSELNNPLNQLSRSETMLRQLLQSLGFHSSVIASVVFINPEFTLYQAPLDKPFIFPSQINRYFKNFNKIDKKLNRKDKMLAENLLSLHINESPFKLLPHYDYDQLRKGITCAACTSFSISIEGRKCVCKECGHEEVVATAVMRSVKEFKLLFPERKMTTNVIQDWCKVVESKKRIKEILEKNYKKSGAHRCSYYE
ncbi:nuclease [Bacillus sp. SA1-12]|uniref:nuclease-related domain-containing protein n=1 Tax=Bacillus sp. SA1-12 TaxID=1455638 RepID=UPI00062679D2|nr:nuclease-related domain-containing protein [Bacillus sp. SA1-12]KKI93288.1 nuclease [Bacillus sp. SA1-12]